MKDILTPHRNPMLIKRRRLHNLMLHRIVQILQQLQPQRPYDHTRRYTINQQLVQLLPRRHQPLRTLLLRHLRRQLGDEQLPVGLADGFGSGERSGGGGGGAACGDVGGFEHECCAAHVAGGFAGDVDG